MLRDEVCGQNHLLKAHLKAFRGELVVQDPNDEPASVLLERVKAEREAAEADKKSKKRKPNGGRRKRKREVRL